MEEYKLLKSQGFLVQKTIGQGAFGRVYLVHHPQLGIVAAKVMDNQYFDASEWDIAGVLQQDPPQFRPFIINNILAKQFKQSTVLLIDYANCGNMKQLIDKNIDLPLNLVRVIMNQLRLIHRDIKGQNIMLHNPTGSGCVILKIADFGLVKVKKEDEQSTLMSVAGTKPFMAPELQLAPSNELQKADANVDVWSLGILMLRFITHSFPFNPHDPHNIRQFMVNRVLIRPPTITDNLLWDLLVRMLSFDRHTRISAAEALQHPFFTGEQAMREISPQQYQLAHDSQRRGDQTITQFDINPLFIFPLTDLKRIFGPIDSEADLIELHKLILLLSKHTEYLTMSNRNLIRPPWMNRSEFFGMDFESDV
ncbi:MAG: putative AGC family protein kinase [Streblomastix strix]|uniref:Putative AGC family protein kinase n=1 Tax=Streblomastix strix TaxID=222440 RepID=A0A5J4UM01_9EUKA|nr:MAG: putative AGC family protein kinase [Streblomastix strix]